MSYKGGKGGGSLCQCICRILSMVLTVVIIGAGGYAAWFFLGQPTKDELLTTAKDIGDKVKNIDFGDFTDVLENFTGFSPDLFNEDPYVGDNTTNVWVGHTSGQGGLYLELWNALDDNWQSEYREAVNDWNERCNPKVLVLTSKDVAVDNECTQQDGVMKVCNGNYLETGWLGINEVLKSVPQGIIQSSVAKMNEHYLLNADYDERLYTMCHELGHGYGLPHTDENFNNKDQGNCLDYTNNPSNNLRPGLANCNRLYEMYGSVNIGRNRRKNRRSLRYRSDAEMYEDFLDIDLDNDENDINSENSEEEESMMSSSNTDDSQYYFEDARLQYPDMSEEYEKAMKELYYDISQGNIISLSQSIEEDQAIPTDVREKWRCLKEHPRGGQYSRKLNDGFVLEVSVLFPREA